jgi:hypothetical protein
MFSSRAKHSWTFIAAVALVVCHVAYAQERPPEEPPPPTPEELVKLIDGALPQLIQEDNSGLVGRLMQPKLGIPLSESFVLETAVTELFGRARPTFAPDCQRKTSPSGDPDLGECTAARGSEAGKGAYTRLSFSKHMGLGNIKYMRRPAEFNIGPEDLKPVPLSDPEAYEKAVGFLVQTFGLPFEEIPQPPPGAENPIPVRDLVMEWIDETGQRNAVPIQKVVSLRRGLLVELDLLPWVPAPGEATVVMDEAGVSAAMVRDWQELRPHPGINPGRAKSRTELTEEILSDLLNINKTGIASMSSQILISRVPDGTHGLLLPAVQMYVSPVPRDPSEEEQMQFWSTAGFVREYPLVHMNEGKEE